MSTLRVVDIVEGTSVDGPGLRTSVYLAGCAHRCPGCHNPSTWSFEAGRDVTLDEIIGIVERNGYNVTFTGGDPLYSAQALIPLAAELRKRGYDIWCYTGFTFEELLSGDSSIPQGTEALLEKLSVLVDGPYIESLRDTSLMFRGSSNQRILDLPASLRACAPILHSLHYGPSLPEF